MLNKKRRYTSALLSMGEDFFDLYFYVEWEYSYKDYVRNKLFQSSYREYYPFGFQVRLFTLHAEDYE